MKEAEKKGVIGWLLGASCGRHPLCGPTVELCVTARWDLLFCSPLWDLRNPDHAAADPQCLQPQSRAAAVSGLYNRQSCAPWPLASCNPFQTISHLSRFSPARSLAPPPGRGDVNKADAERLREEAAVRAAELELFQRVRGVVTAVVLPHPLLPFPNAL